MIMSGFPGAGKTTVTDQFSRISQNMGKKIAVYAPKESQGKNLLKLLGQRDNIINGKETKASKLFKKLNVGEHLHKNNLVIVYGTEVYISGKKITDKKGGLDYVIIISYYAPRKCFEKYKMRWEIEHMFKALKSSGFNMESTHVTNLDRLDTLLEIITIAFFWAYLTGDYLIKSGKELIKIKKHGRPEKSIFKLGLECLNRAISTHFKKYLNDPYYVLSCTQKNYFI